MQISAEKQGNVLYLRLSGEVDEHNAHLARVKADRLADDYAGSARADFALKEVSFMDSTGIGFLIGRYKKFHRLGIPVYIAGVTSETDRILSISGVYTLIQRI